MLLALQSAVRDQNSHRHPFKCPLSDVECIYAIHRWPLGPQAVGCKPKLTRQHYISKKPALFTESRVTRYFFLWSLREIL